MAIRCRKYAGGIAAQSHMGEAFVLRKHFPREIPMVPKVHVGGTTSLKLASVTLGQEEMLEKLENKMRDSLGAAVCKHVIKQVGLEMVASKKVVTENVLLASIGLRASCRLFSERSTMC